MNYSGKVLINTRHAPVIEKILLAPEPPKGEQLNSLLSFLSVYALSDGLLYDNTVPADDIIAAIKVFEKWDIFDDIGEVNHFEGDKFITLVTDSLHQCLDEVLSAINLFKNWQPVDPVSKATAFFDVIEEINLTNDYARRRDIAFQAFNNKVMGGKLLIAIASPMNEKVLSKLISLDLKNDNDKAQVLSAIVGTFRTFLLSNTAVRNEALFYTEPKFVTLLQEKNFKTWNMLVDELKHPRHLLKTVNNEPLIGDEQFPLIGAAVIFEAASKGLSQHDLFYLARRSDQVKKMSGMQKELLGRYERANSHEDIIKEMRDLWHEMNQPNLRTNQESLKSGLIYTIVPNILAEGIGTLINNLSSKDLKVSDLFVGSVIQTTFLLRKHFGEKITYLNALSNVPRTNPTFTGEVYDSLKTIWRKG